MIKRKKTKRENVPEKISHLVKPGHLSLQEWQIVLRRQMARELKLRIKNTGGHPVFSNFKVANPATKKSYRVFIGGEALGMSYCSCPDFAVNTLGTCKHIEGVLHKLRRNKHNQAMLQAGWRPECPAVSLKYGIKRQAVFIPGRKSNGKLKALFRKYFDAEGVLTQQGAVAFDGFVKGALRLGENIDYHEDAMLLIAQMKDKAARESIMDKAFSKGIEDPQWDSLFRFKLYPYQKQGALFAARAGRSLIADEMGLGKTIQAIAASEIMARHLGVDKVLVICPASLKHQWKAEIGKMTGRQAQIVSGPLLERARQYRKESFFKIINYDVVYRDSEAIRRWSPDLIILDEAQRIKNWRTRLAQSVKRLQSPYAIVLTGTPLENRLEELHSIVEFIDRHHLGPLFRFIDAHQMVDPEGKMKGYKGLNNLGKSLAPIMVRRCQKEVLEQLPARMDKNHFVPMTSQQMAVHNEYRDLVARLTAKWRKCHFLTEEEKKRLMMALQNMRMVCNSTYLLDGETNSGNKMAEAEEQLGEILEDPQAKVVIFSQWLGTMELIIRFLDRRKWSYVFLHGGVPSAKRGGLIERFREDDHCRIFLSTEAGGVGLNLQKASFVINMDLPWNPAVLEQRISRVHRLGQKNPVRVINFIAENTIEHGMLGLLGFKKSLFVGVLDGGQDEVVMSEGRFNQLMKTVEEVAKGPQGRPVVQEPAPAVLQEQSCQSRDVAAAQSSLPLFLKMAADFLQNISATIQNRVETQMERGPQGFDTLHVRQDPLTGQKSLHIPLPDDQTLDLLAQTFGKVLNPTVHV